MPNWCRSRISPSGPNAGAFKRDFMASYNRNKCNEDCSVMDGAFVTKSMAQLNRQYEAIGVKIAPGGPTCKPIFSAKPDHLSNAVEFVSKWSPVHEIQHLTAISCAYPALYITYDYAEQGCGLYGRWTMQGGAVNCSTPSELEAAKREAAFKKIIANSG